MSNLEVRFAFVEMLFALAIAEVAVAFSHLVSIDRALFLKIPAIAHLLLATLLIAASWLGWSTSRWRSTSRSDLASPFTWDFIGLLLDVLLVVIYFILVRLADVSEAVPYDLLPPSAAPEALWIARIFGIYAVWDLVSDVIKEPAIGWRVRSWFRVDALKISLACMACSLLCTLLASTVYLRAEKFGTLSPGWLYGHNDQGVMHIVWLDCALACVVLLFRALKNSGEALIWRHVTSIHRFEAFKIERKVDYHEDRWAALLSLGYMLFLVLGW